MHPNISRKGFRFEFQGDRKTETGRGWKEAGCRNSGTFYTFDGSLFECLMAAPFEEVTGYRLQELRYFGTQVLFIRLTLRCLNV